MRTIASNDSALALPFPPFPAGESAHAALACLRGISRPSWLAEYYRGGRLLKVRKEPRERGPRPPMEQWQQAEGYDGPVDFETVGTGANMCRIPHPGRLGPMPRGAVAGFTLGSRMRLLCKMNMISPSELAPCPKFITLTYPRELLPDWKWGKYQLDQWLHGFFRKWGKTAAIWRMEFQDDGSMHFHIMAFIARFIPWRWISSTWDTLIGNQVDPRDSASTQIQAMRNWRQTSYYVSKYIAKADDIASMDIFHGRHWGVRYWKLLPVHKVIVALTEGEGYALRRWIRRFRLAKGIPTRDLGHALPFCHQSEAGIMMFLAEADTLRMIALCRGYDGFGVAPP
jgi:hypothetical protein